MNGRLGIVVILLLVAATAFLVVRERERLARNQADLARVVEGPDPATRAKPPTGRPGPPPVPGVAGGSGGGGAPAAASLVGKPAPEIAAGVWFNLPAGKEQISLASNRGKVTLVEFWATWCPPCRESIPHLNSLHAKLAGRGVVIVGLTDEPRAKVEPFLKKMEMKYVVAAESKSLAHYGVRTIPHAFVVDPAGVVVWAGNPAGQGAELEATLERLSRGTVAAN